eukprot:2566337-Heterocapsa_arctica.AAC.1
MLCTRPEEGGDCRSRRRTGQVRCVQPDGECCLHLKLETGQGRLGTTRGGRRRACCPRCGWGRARGSSTGEEVHGYGGRGGLLVGVDAASKETVLMNRARM